VVLLADLGGRPERFLVPPVAALLAALPPDCGLPAGGWAEQAVWAVLCPTAEDPYGLLREVELAWADGVPQLTGRERVVPADAAAQLYRERDVRPMAEVVAELARTPAVLS
jgi:hypothetical protein